jgi:metallo-beta-lactamase family protein
MTQHNQYTLSFYGGVGSVTGANFMMQGDDATFLVDCGMYQGAQFDEDENREPFPYDPAAVDVLLVTHAHADHIGRIPKLVREGFRGTIYSTPVTKEIATVMFADSLSIVTEEAHERGVEPPYGQEDIDRALSLWETVPYHTECTMTGDFSVVFRDAGHILGSAIIEVTKNDRTIAFTGDVGNAPAPLLRAPEPSERARYMVMESVYGDRDHEGVEDRRAQVAEAVRNAAQRGGALLIPAFSLERTQDLLYAIRQLIDDGEVPALPVFLDSPLAIEITRIYRQHADNYNETVQEEIASGERVFDFENLTFTESVDESKAIWDQPNPKIIIAGSGMSNAGRIVHHEKKFLPDPNSTLMIVGYQAAGSRGRLLQDGANEVQIHDDDIPVRAEVVTIHGYSAHADREGLLDIVEAGADSLERIFVTMGEPRSSMHLAQRIREYFGIEASVPEYGDHVTLSF